MNILITGGASGLGEAITRKLAQDQQNKVYFTYSRSEENARKIEAELPNAIALACDFTKADSISNFEKLMAELDLDVLVNNAITGFVKKHFHKMQPEDFLQSFQHNILPTIRISQLAINIFRKKRFGKIITILSAATINKPPIGWSEYVANKEYLYALSKSWATENISFNITANCVSPAFMLTKLNSETDERIVSEMEKQHPLKRLLTPLEVAGAVDFFVNASQQINGTNLIINAGGDLK